jgi:hypothetical protein
MGKRRGIVAILAVAAVCLLVAGVGAYASHAVLDEAEFADRAVATLGSDEVRHEVGARIGSRLASDRPELSPGEQMMEDAVAESVTADPTFQQAFRDGAARLHRALFADPDAEASMTVAGSGAMLTAELRRRIPQQRTDVPRMHDVPLFSIGGDGSERTARRIAPAARDVAFPLSLALAIAGLALLAIAVIREPDHRRTVWGAGLAVAAAGGVTAVGVTAAQDFVLDNFDTSFGDAVVTSVWDAYLAELRLWALAIGAGGLVVAAAAGGPRPSLATMLAAPASRGGRAARAAGLLAVAALAVQIPELVLHTGLVALAAALFYVAAGDLLRVLAPPQCAAHRTRLAAGATALLALLAAAAVV